MKKKVIGAVVIVAALLGVLGFVKYNEYSAKEPVVKVEPVSYTHLDVYKRQGKEMIAAYCKTKSITLSNIMTTKYQEIVQKKYGFKDWDAVLAALGHGGLKEGQVVNRLVEEYDKEHKQVLTDASVLEKVAEASKNKVHIAKSKSCLLYTSETKKERKLTMKKNKGILSPVSYTHLDVYKRQTL